MPLYLHERAVCDTAKVRFFKQITTLDPDLCSSILLFVILQKYDFSSKSQPKLVELLIRTAVCDTAKVRFFKQITTCGCTPYPTELLFVILQKYDFSSKSQRKLVELLTRTCCLWYCKSTIFQANHNWIRSNRTPKTAVCDTAKVRFFKQITTPLDIEFIALMLFVILQKYDFSSKSQLALLWQIVLVAVCDTAKVRFFKQITTDAHVSDFNDELFVILQKYDFSSKSQQSSIHWRWKGRCLWYCKSTIFQANHNLAVTFLLLNVAVCDTAKVRFFKQITTTFVRSIAPFWLFVILQKYDFSSKSQLILLCMITFLGCLWYCKSTIFQANHNSLPYALCII